MKALGLLVLSGCITGGGYSTRDKVVEATREYNDDVRWGRYESASRHVPKELRRGFVDRHKKLEDELEIADYEVFGIDIDPKKTSATARVEYTWTLKRVGLVHKSATRQRWENRDGTWVVTAEIRETGTPL